MNSFILVLVTISIVSGVEIRLVPPENPKDQVDGTGRVEIKVNDEWSTICDKAWDINDANVACMQLGFIKALYETNNAKYGQGKGTIARSGMQCKGNEKSLDDCGYDQEVDTSCTHANDAGVKCLHTAVPQLLEVGCFSDVAAKRVMPHLFANFRSQIDWYNVRSVISKCAERAHEEGYKYFGVQFWGECWGSKNAEVTFDDAGKSTNCERGVGKHYANFVYRFAPWKDLGCWADFPKSRTMRQIANFRQSINWRDMAQTVEKCLLKAKELDYKYFAVQFYGECWASNDEESYKNHGVSTGCWSGVGKRFSNYVYKALEQTP